MKKTISILLVSCILLPQLAFAGAWTLPKRNIWGEYFFKINYAKREYDSNGKSIRKANGARTWGWSMIPAIEYGVTDWLTAIWKIEYKEGHYKEYSRPGAWGPYSVKNHGVTETQVGARLRILEDPVVFSTQLKGFIYTGYNNGKEGLARQPGLSDACDSLEWRFLFGKFVNSKIPFYGGLETGYRWRNRDVANDIPFFVEFGFWPVKWLLVKTEIDGYWCHRGTGNIRKEYAVWRIGPVIQLLDIYRLFRGDQLKGNQFADDVTLKGKSFNLEIQYGETFWGRGFPNGVSQDHEVVFKISGQY
ncbi:MAG: hypothetical protein HQ594_05985 [Candidatus Omnitrophica bacterium]|nr:hypothetical protein [Candidatus Omnitrophota bacterium]